MTGKTGEKVKGRAKEAAGALSDDRKLKREGRKDQLAGGAKEKFDQAKEKLDSANERLRGDE